jgi:hypothetical protein
MVRSSFLTAVSILALAGAAPRAACAADLLSRDAFSGVIVAGPSSGSGEASWLRGGLGKLQTGGDQVRLEGSAIVAWRSSFNERVGALVTAHAQSLANSVIGLDEAYITLRPTPGAALRLSGRAGLFFPPASLEHDGTEWSLARTLTPSAINSWIAEEVKVAGAEATLRGAFAGHPIGATVAVFQGNDTSGTLLAFRGWALHDLRANLGGTFKLPTTPAMFAGTQAQFTRPVDEVDGRWGGYARLDYAPTTTLDLSLFGYDNNGDRSTVVDGQYAWRTRFVQAAARWAPDSDTEILAQAMTGESAMGPWVNGRKPADVGFSAAYVLASRTLKTGTATARLDHFSVSDRTFKALDNNAEHGWAATAAWSFVMRERSEIVLEGVAVSSVRQDRSRFGTATRQDSLQGRAAFRTSF